MSSGATHGSDATPASSAPRLRDDKQQEDEHADASSTHVSPVMRVYRHALESIFSLLDLSDLSRALAVSRAWAAAVKWMKPIHASIERVLENKVFRPLPPVERIVGSPLLRHLAAIHIRDAGTSSGFSWTPLSTASLALLVQHAPNLQSLWCDLTLTPTEPLFWPAKLTSLNLALEGDRSAASVNRVLTTLSALPLLSRLCLHLVVFDATNSVELRLLAACPSLSDLKLESSSRRLPCLTGLQLEQIRVSLGHLQRLHIGSMSTNNLAVLLQPPVTARWQDIGSVWADQRAGELLVTLQSLTKLDVSYTEHTAHVDFLAQLPSLTALRLAGYNYANNSACCIPAGAVVSSLVRCSSITELSLRCGLSSAHWSALFAKLTKLKKLTIHGGLETLRCFTSGPITLPLEELSMIGLNLPPAELSDLSGLHRLRTLDLNHCFSPQLDVATITSLFPPTLLLPALEELFHLGSWSATQDERRGPSFAWMQQRLTQ